MPHSQHTIMKIAHGLGQVPLAELVTFFSFPHHEISQDVGDY